MSDSVHNIMETHVEERIETCIKAVGGCDCGFCRADIKAIALNKLPSRYVSRLKGSLFARIDASRLQDSTGVLTVVTEAAKFVKEHPRHDD